MQLDLDTFTTTLNGPGARQLAFQDGRPRFVLRAAMFERDDLESLCATARAIRALDAHTSESVHLERVLRRKRVLHLFVQPSTRTCESFAAATEKLGGSARIIQDLSATSFVKGESIRDAVQVWAASFDLLVLRHSDERFVLACAHSLALGPHTMPLISAGSGTLEHPTQGLLDIFTLLDSLGSLDDRTIAIVGDASRNRSARSLATLLSRFERVRIAFVCPPAFEPEQALIESLTSRGVQLEIHHRLGPLLAAHGQQLDAIYVTRLQQEWDEGEAAALGTDPGFVLQPEHQRFLRPDCRILHPLPRVNELPTDWDDHPGFLIWAQVRNGIWARAALMATQLGADAELRERALELR